jgi:pimeloyl-ACP methyl ester carboxylesterase
MMQWHGMKNGWKIALLSMSMSGLCFAQHSDTAREQRFAQDIIAQLVVGDAVQINAAPHARASGAAPSFLGVLAEAGSKAKPAIVLAHGVGTHPEEGLTGELRKRLHELGYTTLAIQMPIAAKDAQIDDYFPKLFPEAAARLESAAQWLMARGYARPVLVSHTMGSWMANVHFDQSHRSTAYKAWVCISLTGGYSLATRNYPFPVLDLYGENDIAVTVSSAWRRAGLLRLAAEGSQQIKVAGADAQWRGKEGAAATEIDAYLRKILP